MTKGTSYQICRLCGYIREFKDGIICPACAAPATTFIPYQHKASTSRLKFLELELHPVTVHFTVSYTFSLAVLFILQLMTPSLLGINIRDSELLDFFVYFLPIFVVLGGITGILDGKTRYRKLRTPYLSLKIILEIILLVVSLIILVTHIASDGGSKDAYVAIEAIAIVSAAIVVGVLGLFSSKLIRAIVPRGVEKP